MLSWPSKLGAATTATGAVKRAAQLTQPLAQTTLGQSSTRSAVAHLIAPHMNVGGGEEAEDLLQHALQEGKHLLIALRAAGSTSPASSGLRPHRGWHLLRDGDALQRKWTCSSAAAAQVLHSQLVRKAAHSSCRQAQPRERAPTAQYTSSCTPQCEDTSFTSPEPAGAERQANT